MVNVVSIITMIAALVALTLSIICIVKREKYSSALVMTDKDAIGLQNFDIQALQTKVDALQTTVDRLATAQSLLGLTAVKYGDKIGLTGEYGDIGTCNPSNECPGAAAIVAHGKWTDTQNEWNITCKGRAKSPTNC